MKKNFVLFSLLLLSSRSFGADPAVDFYTYGGFETVVDGFKRIALIFNNNGFIGLVAAFVAFGVMGGAAKQIFAATTSLAEGKGATVTPASLLVPVILGATLFKAIITPTAVVHIYDDRQNSYESVAGVPSLVAYIASGMNLIERQMIDTIDASSALPYGTDGGGISFKLLYSAMESASNINSYDMMNLKRYFADCGQYALSNAGNDVNAEEITSNTDDLSSLLSEMTSSAISTVMYNASNKAGVTATCAQAYTGYIKTYLDDADTTANMLSLVCKKSGFDSSNALQLNACTSRLNTAIENLYNTSGGVDANQFIRGAIISQAIAEQITDEDPDSSLISMTNKTMMANGLSTAIGSQEWYDTIKANLTVVVLGIMPILTLLIVTPLVKKALPLMFSLFGFITLWGIIDAYQHQAINDAMMRTVQDIQSHRLGLKAFWLTPNATAKALAVLGDSRSQALGIAAALSSALFGLSAYGLSGIGQNSIAKAEGAANESGQETLDPVNSSKYLDDVVSSQGIANRYANDGYNKSVDNSTYDGMRASTSTQAQIQALGGSPINAAKTSGQVDGGKVVGDTQAFSGTPAGGFEAARITSNTNTQENIGNASASRDVATNHGQSVSDHTQKEATFNKEQSVATNAGIKAGSQELGVDPHAHKQEQTAKQTVSSTGETDATYRNMELIKGNTGNNAQDTRLAAEQNAALNGPRSKIIAAEGNINTINRTETDLEADRINANEGKNNMLDRAGTSRSYASFAEGQSEGATLAGQAKVYDRTEPNKILDGAELKSQEEVSQGSKGFEIAQRNGGVENYSDDKAETTASEAAAHVEMMQGLSEALGGKSLQDVALKKEGADVEMAIDANDAATLAENGLMTKEQSQSVIENGGGKFDGSLIKQQEHADLPVDYYVSATMTGTEIEKTDSGYVINDIEPHQAQHFFNQGQITEDQYQSIVKNGGGSMAFETDTKDGFTTATSRVFTGDSNIEDNSTSIDRSNKFNDQNTVETSAYVGGEDSARVVATDGAKLNMALRGQEDKATLAASIATAGLSGIYATEDQVSNVDSLTTSAGVKTPDGLPASADASLSTSTHETENERTNSTYGAMYQAYNALDAEANDRGLDGEMKDEWVADEFARLNKHILHTANNKSADASSNEPITNGIQNYMGDMGYKVAEDNIDSPNFLQYKPGNDMNNLEGKK